MLDTSYILCFLSYCPSVCLSARDLLVLNSLLWTALLVGLFYYDFAVCNMIHYVDNEINSKTRRGFVHSVSPDYHPPALPITNHHEWW